MMSILFFIRMIPSWMIIAAFSFLGVGWFGYNAGSETVQAEWDADKALIASAQLSAMNQRIADNSTIEAKQAATAATIQGKYDAEIDSVRRALADARRMRKPAFCSDRPASTTDTASTGSGDATDTGAGLVSVEVDESVKALILDVETALAAGRSAQAFIRANGMSAGQ